jgi:hypothetical protein
VVLGAAVAVWTFLDLFLRVDLPGAATAAHLAFRGLTGPLRWLHVHTEQPLRAALIVWLLLLPLTRRRPRLLVAWLGVSSVALACAQLVAIAIAILMERATAVGVVVAVITARTAGGGRGHAERTDLRQMVGPGLTAGVCLVLIFALYDTRTDYAMPLALGGVLRGGGSLGWVFGVAAGVVASAGVFVVAKRAPARLLRLSAAVAAGFAAAVASRMLPGGDSGPMWPIAVSVPAGLTLALSAASVVPPLSGGRWARPATWIRALVPAVPVAVLLFGQAYATRLFVCPPPAPGLERIAVLPEVFRIALNEDASVAMLSVRGSAKLVTLRLQPNVGTPVVVDPGPAAGPLDTSGAGRLIGRPEDLVHVPSTGGWISGLVPEGYARDADSVESRFVSGGGCDAVGDFGSLMVDTAVDGGRVEGAWTLPDLCWVSTTEWDGVDQRLLMGWEYRSGMHRLDPTTGESESHPLGDEVGDIIAFAPDPDPAAGRLFTVSLWTSRWLCELDRSTLAVRRRVPVGGTNYDVVLDEERDALFVSSFYGGRVRTVDAATMERTPSLPTAFGTRALAVLPTLDLLVASSTYDGALRFWDLASRELVGTITVGGHVKSLAIDDARGLVYFWSQCGLFRLDVGASVRGPAALSSATASSSGNGPHSEQR